MWLQAQKTPPPGKEKQQRGLPLRQRPAWASGRGPDSSSDGVQGGHVAGGPSDSLARAGPLTDQGVGPLPGRQPASESTLSICPSFSRPPTSSSLYVHSPSSPGPAAPTSSFVSGFLATGFGHSCEWPSGLEIPLGSWCQSPRQLTTLGNFTAWRDPVPCPQVTSPPGTGCGPGSKPPGPRSVL